MRDTAWPTSPIATSTAHNYNFLQWDFPLPLGLIEVHSGKDKAESKGQFFGATGSLQKGNILMPTGLTVCITGWGDWSMVKAPVSRDLSFAVLAIFLARAKEKTFCLC